MARPGYIPKLANNERLLASYLVRESMPVTFLNSLFNFNIPADYSIFHYLFMFVGFFSCVIPFFIIRYLCLLVAKINVKTFIVVTNKRIIRIEEHWRGSDTSIGAKYVRSVDLKEIESIHTFWGRVGRTQVVFIQIFHHNLEGITITAAQQQKESDVGVMGFFKRISEQIQTNPACYQPGADLGQFKSEIGGYLLTGKAAAS